MEKFTNIKQEIQWSHWYFRDHIVDPTFDYRARSKTASEYYRRRGFFASMMFSDFYSKMSGVESDRYMPMDIYLFYALPCLNRWDMRLAYADKNIYTTLFPDVAQPQTVVRNVNGLYYAPDGRSVSERDAVTLVLGRRGRDAIIKPTVNSCNGERVTWLREVDAESVAGRFREYGVNFIVQEKVEQHPEMGRVNASSLNTLRIYTYRDAGRTVRHLSTTVKFGGGGDFAVDNVSISGGCMCKVLPDGRVDDRALGYRTLATKSLERDYGVADLVVPSYPKAIELAKELHRRLAYFDCIGWDIGIREDGEPVFIEMNILPAVELPQMVHGPMFGDYLDEVMDRVGVVRKTRVVHSVNRFRDGFSYLLPIG